MAELEEISDALKLIDAKKESLHKAFEDLGAHSSCLSSFTLTWPAIDAHFSAIQSSLTRQFETLQSRTGTLPVSNALTSNKADSLPPQDNACPSHPKLKSICAAMDGESLLRYIMDQTTDHDSIRSELLDAFQIAADPAKMILDAVAGFFPPKAMDDGSSALYTLRRSCVLMLEMLMLFSPEIGEDVRQRAKSLAERWKVKLKIGNNPLKPLGFLHLLGAYRLGSDYDTTELIEHLMDVVRYREVLGLCRGLNLVDKVPDLIQMLISSGKKNMAIKFVFEFKLTDKFPPIPLLKDIVESSRTAAKKLRKDANFSLQSVNEAAVKEINALKLVIKYIKEYNLDDAYPVAPLEKRLENIVSSKAARARINAKKRAAVAPAAGKFQKQPQQKKRSKQAHAQARTTAPAGPSSSTGTSSSAAPFQQPHFPAPGLEADGPVPYANLPSRLRGFAGATPIGFPGNIGPPVPHIDTMEPQLPMPFAHGGFGLPSLYPPSYFPRQ